MQRKNPYLIEGQLKISKRNSELDEYNEGIQNYIDKSCKGELSLYNKTVPSIKLSSHKLEYDWYVKPVMQNDLIHFDHINEIVCAEVMRYFIPSVPKYRLHYQQVTLKEYLKRHEKLPKELCKSFFMKNSKGDKVTLQEYIKEHKKLPSQDLYQSFFMEEIDICSKRVGYSSSERGKYDEVMTLEKYMREGMIFTSELKEQFIKINALYAILGNVDGNIGNYLIYNNNLIPIDFGYAFRCWNNLPLEVIQNQSIIEGQIFHCLYKKLEISEIQMLNGVAKFLNKHQDLLNTINDILEDCAANLIEQKENREKYVKERMSIIDENIKYFDECLESRRESQEKVMQKIKSQQNFKSYLGKRERNNDLLKKLGSKRTKLDKLECNEELEKPQSHTEYVKIDPKGQVHTSTRLI